MHRGRVTAVIVIQPDYASILVVQGHGLLLSSLLYPVYPIPSELVSQMSENSAVSYWKYNGSIGHSFSEFISVYTSKIHIILFKLNATLKLILIIHDTIIIYTIIKFFKAHIILYFFLLPIVCTVIIQIGRAHV